ncbi:nucleotidyltransferase family protein [Neobacillus sp. D3-1R]|uniref:nucleotidyltransferase family protein n=1 Tax=Neobacillus sp. D3-1R TaxID=3445778 RepID=UPI003F9FABE5
MEGLQVNQVWGIVLAAGYSKRMGTDKMLLPYKDKSILRHVIDQSLNSSLSGISVVVNPEIPGLFQEAEGGNKILINDQASKGMSTSIKLGINSVPNDMKAVMFLLGDQPLLSSEEINRVIYEYNIHGSLMVQACYKGEKGHPVLFDREMFPHLLNLSGDEGARSVLKKYQKQIVFAEINKDLIRDIDTITDYEELIGEKVS